MAGAIIALLAWAVFIVVVLALLVTDFLFSEWLELRRMRRLAARQDRVWAEQEYLEECLALPEFKRTLP